MKEIKTYREKSEDTVKVFFSLDNGKVSSIAIGNQLVPLDQGYQFHVKRYVADQIEKCDLVMDGLAPRLVVKDGEKIIKPTEEQNKLSEIQELKRKLKELEDNT